MNTPPARPIRRVPQGRARAVLAAVLAIVALGAWVWLLRPHPPQAMPVHAALVPTIEPAADWCPPPFELIAGSGCFVAPPATRADVPLIVYLHGRYARDAATDEVDRQRRLAARATGRGFAVLALRGGLGVCTDPELANWFCWPSNERNAGLAETFVSSWERPLASAHERTGSRRRFLLGFSSGGYFAGLIASRGLLDVDALVVAHAGPVEPVHALRGQPPLLLLSADDDIAQDEMIRFDEELARERWAHDSYARAGGHALTDEDIDAALTFFSRAHEPLPLEPPLPMNRPVRHTRDAETLSPSADDCETLSPSADDVEEPSP
jgi:predicted esterase